MFWMENQQLQIFIFPKSWFSFLWLITNRANPFTVNHCIWLISMYDTHWIWASPTTMKTWKRAHARARERGNCCQHPRIENRGQEMGWEEHNTVGHVRNGIRRTRVGITPRLANESDGMWARKPRNARSKRDNFGVNVGRANSWKQQNEKEKIKGMQKMEPSQSPTRGVVSPAN
jgi:hypothetical protein